MKEITPELTKYLALIGGNLFDSFEKFRNLLLDYNSRFNLTSVTEKKDVTYKHFLDSVAGESVFSEGASVAEIGSGAGFPSIPLKLVRKDLKFTLFESIRKKCDFLRIVAKELEFSDMEICNMRAEDAGRDERYRERFDFCCARAVARLNTLAEYCLPLVKEGGRFVAYKGSADEEIEDARRAIGILGGKIEQICSFSLPEGYGERTLIVIKKINPTPSKYPRGRGKERSDPL